MNADYVFLATAIVNTLAVFGIVWKGGHTLGRIEEGMKDHDSAMTRVTNQLDALERRVGRLEGRQ
jgi:hypothetical protein